MLLPVQSMITRSPSDAISNQTRTQRGSSRRTSTRFKTLLEWVVPLAEPSVRYLCASKTISRKDPFKRSEKRMRCGLQLKRTSWKCKMWTSVWWRIRSSSIKRALQWTTALTNLEPSTSNKTGLILWLQLTHSRTGSQTSRRKSRKRQIKIRLSLWWTD